MPNTHRLPACLSCLMLAIVLEASTVQASGVNPSEASAVQRVQAQTRFTRGKQFLSTKEYDKALVELRASVDIVASPNTRLLIARTLRDMGRLIESYAEFGRTTVEADELAREDSRYKNAASAAHEERTSLSASLGFVTLELNRADDTTKVRVAGEEIARPAWSMPVPVLPGRAEITVEAAGHPAIRKIVTLVAGQTATVAIDVQTEQVTSPSNSIAETTPPVNVKTQPSESTPSALSYKTSVHPLVYAGGAVGLAGLATFAIAGSLARSSYNTLEDSCHDRLCAPEMADEITKGKTQQAIANLGLGIGLAGIATSVTMYFLGGEKKPARDSSTAVVVSPGFVGIRGRL